jgi:hypothetical protein
MPIEPPHQEEGADLLAQARETLRDRPRPDRYWAALGAAALFAICAIVFAAAAVLSPPLSRDPAARNGTR